MMCDCAKHGRFLEFYEFNFCELRNILATREAKCFEAKSCIYYSIIIYPYAMMKP